MSNYVIVWAFVLFIYLGLIIAMSKARDKEDRALFGLGLITVAVVLMITFSASYFPYKTSEATEACVSKNKFPIDNGFGNVTCVKDREYALMIEGGSYYESPEERGEK